jgi:hypothetical protein
MRAFVHIIVEEHHGHWMAWFGGAPEFAFGGQWPVGAMRRLLDAVGGDQFDTEQITAIENVTNDGHLEFRIPYRERRRIPVPSVN